MSTGEWISKLLGDELAPLLGALIFILLGLKEIGLCCWSLLFHPDTHSKSGLKQLTEDTVTMMVQSKMHCYREKVAMRAMGIAFDDESLESCSLSDSVDRNSMLGLDIFSATSAFGRLFLPPALSSSTASAGSHVTTSNQDTEAQRTASILEDDEVGQGIKTSSRSWYSDAQLTVVLAFSLSFSSIASGIAAGVLGYSVPYTVVAIFVCSFVLLEIGKSVWRILKQLINENLLKLLCGLALITIGILDLPYLDVD